MLGKFVPYVITYHTEGVLVRLVACISVRLVPE